MIARICEVFIEFFARWFPLGSCTGSLAQERVGGAGFAADPTGDYASGRVRRRWTVGWKVVFPIVDLRGPVACYRCLRDRRRRRAQVLAVRPGGRGRSASLWLAEVCAGGKGDELAATITTRNRRERDQRGTGITASGRPGKRTYIRLGAGKLG